MYKKNTKVTMEDYPKIDFNVPSIRTKAEIEIIKKRKELISQIAQSIFTKQIKQTDIIQLIKDEGFDMELTTEEILTLRLFQGALSDNTGRIDYFRIIRYLAGESEKKKMNIGILAKK